MTVELTYLAYTIALFFVVVMVQALAGIRQHGGMTLANNRDDLPSANTYLARTKRLVDNFRENLWFFTPLVLIAAIVGVTNQWTILGAQLFFWARLAHAVWYIAGWPLVRPLFWLAGVIACVLIFLALVGILA
jgi:uncharacterized MAPEG superfamily protein